MQPILTLLALAATVAAPGPTPDGSLVPVCLAGHD